MIIKALIAGCVRLLALQAVAEKPQSDERACRRIRARHPTALNSHRIARQRKAYDRYAGGRARAASIGHQAVFRIVLFQKVIECSTITFWNNTILKTAWWPIE